jgi:hypothetical protein
MSKRFIRISLPFNGFEVVLTLVCWIKLIALNGSMTQLKIVALGSQACNNPEILISWLQKGRLAVMVSRVGQEFL